MATRTTHVRDAEVEATRGENRTFRQAGKCRGDWVVADVLDDGKAVTQGWSVSNGGDVEDSIGQGNSPSQTGRHSKLIVVRASRRAVELHIKCVRRRGTE